MDRDPTIPEYDKLELFQAAVKRFEAYETAVNEKLQPELLRQYQNDCLQLINQIIVESLPNNSDPYSTALFYIRQDLIYQIEKTESERNQIIVNDLVITRTNTSSLNTEPLQHAISKIFSTTDTSNKKSKIDEIRSAIENTLVVSKSTGLSEIAGLEEAKKLLRNTIILPNKYPHLFTGGRKKRNTALLFGPPGTGKTQLAHCLAAEIEARFYRVTNSDLLSCYVGQSEKLIKMLFQHCQETKELSLIFVDEIDSICRVRNATESEHERRFKTQLLIELSEIDNNPNNCIFFLACTNCPWDLDPAFIRRFQQRIYIPLPDRETRMEIFKILTKSEKIFSSIQWNLILDHTDGWSGSDLSELVSFAMFQPIQELTSAKTWIVTDDNMYMPVKCSNNFALNCTIDQLPANKVMARPVELSDFESAFQNVTKSISQNNIKQYDKFINSFK